MIALLADENFHGAIVRGLLRRLSNLDIIRVQDVGLSGVDDPGVLEWAAKSGRVLLTHDVRTITKYAYDRIRLGLPMPGVFEVSQSISIGQAIEEILLLVECSIEGEWDGQIHYVPF